jgi:fructose-1,6-bisphosphatase II
VMSGRQRDQSAAEPSARDAADGPPRDRCMCSEFVPVTEQAALASGRWMGQGQSGAAAEAAVKAMHTAFANVAICGTVVIGDGAGDDQKLLGTGTCVGAGGVACDFAVDALQAADSLARGQDGAMAVIAVAGPGAMMSAPDIYMQKIVTGPRSAGVIDIELPVTLNLQRIAASLDRTMNEITVITLDRPRHEDLVAEIRAAGARIKLIPDGDITASIAVAVGGTGDHVYIGIGGAAEGIITAAAMRCLGGEIQGKFWPLSRREVENAREHGIDDIEMRLTTDDLVRGEVIFAATGVTRGDFLRGVDYFPAGARTHTIIMCTRCRQVRFVDTIHRFGDERREIRL